MFHSNFLDISPQKRDFPEPGAWGSGDELLLEAVAVDSQTLRLIYGSLVCLHLIVIPSPSSQTSASSPSPSVSDFLWVRPGTEGLHLHPTLRPGESPSTSPSSIQGNYTPTHVRMEEDTAFLVEFTSSSPKAIRFRCLRYGDPTLSDRAPVARLCGTGAGIPGLGGAWSQPVPWAPLGCPTMSHHREMAFACFSWCPEEHLVPALCISYF